MKKSQYHQILGCLVDSGNMVLAEKFANSAKSKKVTAMPSALTLEFLNRAWGVLSVPKNGKTGFPLWKDGGNSSLRLWIASKDYSRKNGKLIVKKGAEIKIEGPKTKTAESVIQDLKSAGYQVVQ